MGAALRQIVNRHTGHLALDVPQSHINAGHRIVGDRAVAPIGVVHHHFPKVFNVGDIAANEQGLEILIDKIRYQLMSVSEGSAAETVETRFAGFNLDDDQVDSFRRGADGTHVANGYVAHV